MNNQGRFFAVAALFGFLSVTPAWSSDFTFDPDVLTLAEEVLIADLMLRSCDGILPSTDGMAEIGAQADDLARRFGLSPGSAAEMFSSEEARGRVEAGAIRRLASLGSSSDRLDTLCPLARNLAGGPGTIGTLLLPAAP